MTDNIESARQKIIDHWSLKDSLLISILKSAIVFIVCPTFIVSNNLSELQSFSIAESIKIAVIAFIVFTFLVFAISRISTIRPLIAFLFIFVGLTAFVLPVTSAVGMIDPENHPINIVNLVMSTLIAFIAMLGFQIISTFRTLLINMTGFIAVLIFGLSFFNIQQVFQTDVERRDTFTTLSARKNIIVFSYDGVPGTIINRLLDENADVRQAFKDFTFFPEAYSQSPATNASTIGELYGVHDFKAIASTESELSERIKMESFYTDNYLLKLEDVQLIYHTGPDKVLNKKKRKPEKFPAPFLIESSLSRIFTRHIFKIKISSVLDYIDHDFNEEAYKGTLEEHHGPDWDYPNTKEIGEHDSFVDQLSASDKSDFSVRYYHTVFSHFPVDFDETCTYRSTEKVWYDSHQNETGLEKQTLCILQKMRNVILKLKETGTYDNSVIVFKSDHGEPAGYFNTPPDNYSFNENRRWGYNRYRPFLMIKNYETSESTMQVDTRRVLLNDLAKTLCNASGVQNIDCNQHKGIDLFSTETGLDQPYFMYVVEGPHSSFRFDYHKSVRIPNRDTDVISFLQDVGNIEMIEPAPQLPTIFW